MTGLSTAIPAVLAVSFMGGGAGDGPTDVARLREAIGRGLAVVTKGAGNYPKHRQCFSCHHQTLPMLAMLHAERAGLGLDRELFEAQVGFTHESFRSRMETLEAGRHIGGRSMTVGYGLWALELADRKPDPTATAMVRYLLHNQEPNGQWKTQMSRPPMEDSLVTCTLLAVAGLRRFGSPEDEDRIETAIGRARQWLDAAVPASQEDRVALLWARHWFGVPASELDMARRSVIESQKEDGGWAQLDSMASDAYATGQNLFILHETGTDPADPVYASGVEFLLRTQCPDGSWHVASRSKPVQTFFDNGDPHGPDQFISVPATAWAVTALSIACQAPPVD